MKNRRNYIAFAAGMATMILLVSLLSMSLAKEEVPAAQGVSGKLNGQVAYGEAGIALFGVERAAPGEVLITEKGARVPLVLTYTDEKGGPTTSWRRARRRSCWTSNAEPTTASL